MIKKYKYKSKIPAPQKYPTKSTSGIANEIRKEFVQRIMVCTAIKGYDKAIIIEILNEVLKSYE